VRARGEREGGGRTLSSALLLLCLTTRVHRPAAPSEEPPLHLCLVVRTCRGATLASPPLQASAIRICASAVTVCLRRPSACPQLPVHLVSPPPPAVCRQPSMPLPSLCSAWYAPASSLFPPPVMTLPGAWYPVSALSIVVFNASCSAFAHAVCALLVLCFYITEPSFFSVTHIY